MLHFLSLGIELKTVVVRVETENDVSVLCCGIAYRLEDLVMLLSGGDMGEVDEIFGELVRWFAPDHCLESVLWLGYVDVMGKVS